MKQAQYILSWRSSRDVTVKAAQETGSLLCHKHVGVACWKQVLARFTISAGAQAALPNVPCCHGGHGKSRGFGVVLNRCHKAYVTLYLCVPQHPYCFVPLSRCKSQRQHQVRQRGPRSSMRVSDMNFKPITIHSSSIVVHHNWDSSCTLNVWLYTTSFQVIEAQALLAASH